MRIIKCAEIKVRLYCIMLMQTICLQEGSLNPKSNVIPAPPTTTNKRGRGDIEPKRRRRRKPIVFFFFFLVGRESL